nr:glutamate receptor 2.8-like [Malus domestica]XP_028962550.1 glutamate receptor 2.8-like [Malus domestica]XP_028962551.1 glutamate receptor 2.8-like [Malus domestica]XP_028962552.1 glutamate receptor 2.8-like [Malus domestica]XP_028962553.1 glutamate receptor 2.8-like [Malus domestica]
MGAVKKLCIVFFCFLFLLSWIFNVATVAAVENTTIQVNVGVVVDLDQPSQSGKMYLSCIKMAIEDFYASHAHFKTRLVLNTRDSKQTVVGAAAAALDLIKKVEVQAILGPVTSMQASFVVNLGDQAHVPILSFSATSPSLTSLQSSYFFRITQTDSHQVKAISAIVKNFGWRQVVPIYVDNTYGEGVIPFLIDALQEVDAHVPYRSVIPTSATDVQIEKELHKLMTMQTRVFIVHMLPKLCTKLFAKAKEVGMMREGYVWIMTNGVGNRLWSIPPVVLNSMQGVLGVETDVPSTEELKIFRKRWKRRFQQDNPAIINVDVDVFGFRAYDAAFALAFAVEEVGFNKNSDFRKRNNSDNTTDLDTFEVSQYGPKLSQALSNTSFKGIAGDFRLDDGQLQASTFRIVNVNGDGVRTIAFWTPENGMVKTLNSANTSILSISTSKCNLTSILSTSKCNLSPIIWPGDSFSVPKGWDIPTNDKKMRIGVHVKLGFSEFVKVTKNPSTNTTEVTGFSIDVFEAAVEVLPYALPYEFIPFENSDGTMAGTYNDLVYQVSLEKFDAVVGDTTIRANRSLYVDFTMPYTESGVVMVVPSRDTRSKNAWVFLKPLTWDLWLTTFCFFIFIGFVIWVLEHQINEDFRGPPSHQVGTSFWFSFSTMVISHRERVVSNLARFLMIIWVFVVLVLTQSYTANLASLLTVEQLQPTFTNIKDILRKGENVGCMENSFVCELLMKQIGFHESKLKGMNSMEECDEALSKGSGKGGIAAVVDETPNMKLFIAKYCSKYTMIGPIFKTDGYGFVFPKRSPLVPDISQAVLSLTEGEKIMKIGSKWFSQESNCEDNSRIPRISSNTLGLESFWGLFLIAGAASILALIIFVASFFYKHRHVLEQPDSRTSSRWRRVRAMVEIFNEKDLNSHTFKSRQQEEGIAGVGEEVKASPNRNWPESPFSYANDTDKVFGFYEGQQTPSTTSHGSPELTITVQEMGTYTMDSITS